MKKLVSLTMAVLLTAAFAVPAFAASPTTQKVVVTPVSVPKEITVLKGYELTAEEQALVATTLEEAVALSTGVFAEAGGTALTAVTSSPALIAMAKADILKDLSVRTALAKGGAVGIIANSGMLLRADGKSARNTINLSSAGLVPGQKVAILYYLPGEVTPRVAYPVWKNGKLRVTLPLPCIYNIVK
ncbi:MAG: hypothetical protein IKQ40_00495 [Lachnospiraceae bacterium]|nr:hypothetical protein [Lachnospiraceae bacterium]